LASAPSSPRTTTSTWGLSCFPTLLDPWCRTSDIEESPTSPCQPPSSPLFQTRGWGRR
jgi:hypothetical protein